MGSWTEEEISDDHSDRCGSYSPSADVSDSDSDLSSFRHTRLNSTPSSLPSTSRCPAADFLPDLVGDASAAVSLWEEDRKKKNVDSSEVEMMKERFAKLLLGEDMSGGGKGVYTALAISNAITNLSATVFGELWRLEPLAPQKKAMWRRELEWLLCVSDSIVELTPSVQQFPGGGTFEVMVPRPRSDLYLNLPALKKLDGMLLGMLDGFKETVFWYVEQGSVVDNVTGDCDCGVSSLSRPSSVRQEEKWWLPCPRVPPNGLPEETRNRLQQCRDYANQILKAAMAINSMVLVDMAIPDAYFETMPKSVKSCLGDIIYQYITADEFSPECLLDCLDLSSEHQTLEIANRIEAAVHLWKQKDRKYYLTHGRARRSAWRWKAKSSVADGGKYQLLAKRAESLLQSLRLRYPGLPQTLLDMNKIQYNKDVGQSILESYSRVMESLAFNIIARIDDLIYVDDTMRKFAVSQNASLFNPGGFRGLPVQKKISSSPFSIQNTPCASPFATPSFFSPSPMGRSPETAKLSIPKSTKVHSDRNLLKSVCADIERAWTYTGNLSLRRDSGDAPERD